MSVFLTFELKRARIQEEDRVSAIYIVNSMCRTKLVYECLKNFFMHQPSQAASMLPEESSFH